MKRRFLFLLVMLFLISLACRRSATPTSPPGTQDPITIDETSVPATETPSESFIFPSEPSPEISNPIHGVARETQREVTYCTIDGVALKMDVYFPENAEGKTPLAVFIHGGGWSKGDKADGQGRFEFPSLVEAGFTVISLNYRLAPEYKFPAMIEDVKCAIRSLRAHADEYNIDPNRIGVWGNSAGGHLVNLIGLTDESAGFEQGEYLDQSSRVQLVVDMFGPVDLTTDFSSTFARIRPDVFLDGDRAKASPINYITPDDPPFLILNGDRDPVMPLSQSRQFYKALIAAGVDAQLIVVANGNHGFTTPDITPTREEITTIIVKFFEEHLK